MVTIIELFVVIFVISVTIETGKFVANSFGIWAGIGAGILSAIVSITIVVLLYRARGRRYSGRQRELREKYRRVFRVIAVPGDASKIQKPEGTEIQVGDYGWEAKPLHDDGLIYLQGLTAEWRVVWHAGFRLDQIEIVGEKPQSQYDWNYTWVNSPPPCPYPIQARKTSDLGFPLV